VAGSQQRIIHIFDDLEFWKTKQAQQTNTHFASLRFRETVAHFWFVYPV
jgi:hypothetical protein